MKPKDARKLLRDLRAVCRKHGLELELDEARGKGSHRALRFRDPDTGEEISIVIPGHKAVSPGVQREILIYLAKVAAKVTIAEIVKAIFERLFD
ncbi:hypothetical protein [uncultured Bradyrhizobium sp.]|jgi:predicted RNA binding protein YcfA (HicA-like mRNA interferase family)|uniref:hypothetical protein n=1 Tax=uncultured Bradyrhizobium sp. TaxID=199684 RepID=UPI00261E74A6|nr:hypothetical protein [uncultured Bradyrhizobium sp.]